MGPYSALRQELRRQALTDAYNRSKTAEMRAVWAKHLDNLAVDESEYYQRVREVYSKVKRWENPFDD